MTSGYDSSLRRCRGFSRPFSTAASAIASITPSPRCRSSSPSRTRSGSHAPASTVPSRRTTAGAVTTGRQNTISSPASGTAPAAITVPPPRTRTSQDRSTTVPAGIPPSGDATVRVASTTSGTVESTRAPWHRAGFDTHTLTRSPTCLQTTAKHQVTASSKADCLKSLVLGGDVGAGGTQGEQVAQVLLGDPGG